jgi:hypothetical protein
MWQGATVKRNMGNSVIEWLKVLALKASNCPQHVTDYCDIPSFFRNPRLSFPEAVSSSSSQAFLSRDIHLLSPQAAGL